MKKKTLNGLLIGGISLLTMSSVASMVLTSCVSTTKTYAENNTTPAQNATKKLYQAYDQAVASAAGTETSYVTDATKAAVLKVMDGYTAQAKELQTKIQQSGSVDEKIWIDSVIFQIDIEKRTLTSNAYLVGAPIGGDILTADPNELVAYAENVQYGSSYDEWTSNLTYFDEVIKAIQTNFKAGIAQGITQSGIMLKLFVSNTLQKLYVHELANYLHNNQTTNLVITKDNFSALGKCSYFSHYVDSIPTTVLNGQERTDLLAQAKQEDAVIDTFMNFILTEYWPSVRYGWNTTNNTPDVFKLSIVDKNNTNEKQNTYEVGAKETKTIQGLGITQKDLDTHDIGIGFTPGTNENPQAGLKIYQDYLLYRNTTLYDNAKTVMDLGIQNVKLVKDNMKHVAQFIAPKLTTEEATVWNPTGYTYDNDIFDNVPSQPFVAPHGLATKNSQGQWVTSDAQLLDFFKWLNADQWFFGRDVAANQVVTLPKEATGVAHDLYFAPNNAGVDGKGVAVVVPSIIDKTQTPKPVLASETETVVPAQLPATGEQYSFDMTYAPELGTAKINNEVANNFGDSGDLYDQYIVQAKGIAPGKANISGAQAYAGASFAMDSYYRLRDAILPKVTPIFVKSADSNVHAPSKLDLKTNIVTGSDLSAAYAEGNKFYLDVNPFYCSQKWEITTLLSHESVPGHNLQMIYAIDNTSSPDAPSLSYNAYGEGWGLFSEWLATQYGAYGEPVKLVGDDWLDSTKRMQVPNFDDNAFDKENKQFSTVNINIKEANAHTNNGEFMNGAFETNFNGLSTTEATTLDQGYYNALQYFGFLNDRQLRVMRLVLDPAVHVGGPALKDGLIDETKDLTKIGQCQAGTGWSLQDEINFMQTNSGMGQGDIAREAQRYLNYVGQATSYLTGEIEIENLFGQASAAYAKTHNNALFMDYADLTSTQNNTAPFFNLILRNNDIPLSVLKTYVEQYIHDNIESTSPTTASHQ